MAIKVDPSCRYSKSHEWIRVTNDQAYIGITDYAQQQLSDIVYVEVPEIGDTFGQGEVFGVVESVKAATDCYLPVAGDILDVNHDLEDTPELVNKDPYGDGWFVKITVEDPVELKSLMDAKEYERYAQRALEDATHK
ncbi:MAG: glycine cleavage system protein GcvH [Anaerolineae bacterium]